MGTTFAENQIGTGTCKAALRYCRRLHSPGSSGIVTTGKGLAQMLDLFKTTQDEMRIFIHRIPQRDGTNPSSDGFALSCFLMVMFGLCAYYSKRNDRTVLYSLIAAFSFYHAAKQLVVLVISARTRRIYLSILPFPVRIPVASFSDFREVRLIVQEIDGVLCGCFVGIWRRGIARKPLRFSPLSRSSGQLNHYRHTIIPKVREMIFALQGNRMKPKGNSTATTTKGQPDIDGEVIATQSLADKAAEERKTSGSYRRTFIHIHLLTLIVRVTAYHALYWIIAGQKISFDAGNYTFVLDIIALLVKLTAFVVLLYKVGQAIAIASQKNITISIDGYRQTLTFRTHFGLRKNTFTFDSLFAITIKHVHGTKQLCLILLENHYDPVIAVSLTGRHLASALDNALSVLGVSRNDWLDTLYAIPRPSQSYIDRILKYNDPYYER